MEYLSAIITLILFISIFVGAYYFTKFTAGNYQKNNLYGKNKIEIIERKYISRDQSLMLVKVDDKVFFLGATVNHIDEIATFNSEDLIDLNMEEKEVNNNFKDNFKDVLGKYLNNKTPDDKERR